MNEMNGRDIEGLILGINFIEVLAEISTKIRYKTFEVLKTSKVFALIIYFGWVLVS
jgi:hypothetical protein